MSKATNSQWFTKLILSIGLIFLGICVFFVLQPQYLVPDHKSISVKDRVELENKVRTTWIQAISGLGLFVAAYSAWLNYQSSQRKLEADKKAFKKNLKLADSKQITERFSKAVEQLGNEASITVRLGGIYSLEKIAQDSKHDHWTIMEVLTAFIREKSNINREPNSNIPEDIQAALTVIGRRKTENDPDNGVIDLRGSNLNEAYLYNARLNNASLVNIECRRSTFYDAKLHKAVIIKSKLESACFENANLTNTGFLDVDLTNAWFDKANLTDATFVNVDLTNVSLRGANLAGAKFDFTNFTGTILTETDIKDTIFYDDKAPPKSYKPPTPQQIITAKNWERAIYHPDFFKDVEKFLIEKIESIIIETCFKSRYNKLYIFTRLNIIVNLLFYNSN